MLSSEFDAARLHGFAPEWVEIWQQRAHAGHLWVDVAVDGVSGGKRVHARFYQAGTAATTLRRRP